MTSIITIDETLGYEPQYSVQRYFAVFVKIPGISFSRAIPKGSNKRDQAGS
jgi:hypothetical protein